MQAGLPKIDYYASSSCWEIFLCLLSALLSSQTLLLLFHPTVCFACGFCGYITIFTALHMRAR